MKPTGILLAALLIAAVIAALVMVNSLRMLRAAPTAKEQVSEQQAPVQQVEDVVSQINQTQKNALDALEAFDP